MKHETQLVPTYNVGMMLRRAGYHPILDKRGGKESWVRNLGRAHYPRFHLYISSTKEKKLKLSLHIDQKKSTVKLKGVKRHAGEYSGPVVEQEMERLQRWIAYAESGEQL